MSRLGCVRIGVMFSLAIAGAAIPPGQKVDLQTVLARVGRYVEQYQQEFSLLVCDERYVQEFQQAYREIELGSSLRVQSLPIKKRRLVSEFALARVEGPGGWLWQGFRDVIEVNGRSVRKERNRLEALFSSSPADLIERARAIADESARYNLGQYRTINVPTLALRFLALKLQARQRYEKTGEETVKGVRTWRIAFDEQAWPTVIRTPEGGVVPSKGIAWVDPGTGRIVRTQLEPQHGLSGLSGHRDQAGGPSPGVEDHRNLRAGPQARHLGAGRDGGVSHDGPC